MAVNLLRFGSFRAFVAILFVHTICILAVSSDDACDTSSFLQASLGTVARSIGNVGAVQRTEDHLHEAKPALLQVTKRLGAVAKFDKMVLSIATSIGNVAEHRQPEGNAAAPTAVEQQQPEDNAANPTVAEQQPPEGDAATPTVVAQQQPENDAASPTATEQQQPQGDAASLSAAEQQQPEGDAAAPTAVEQQQPEDNAANPTVAEQQPPEGNAATPTAVAHQQPEDDAASPTATEQQQPQGDAASLSAAEQQQPEGDATTPTIAEQQQQLEDDNISLVPNTSDWQKRYPFEEPQTRPWQWYAAGIGLAMGVLIAAAYLRR